MIQWCHHPAEKKSVPGETLYARFPAAQTAARHRGSHPSVHAGTGRREVWAHALWNMIWSPRKQSVTVWMKYRSLC